MKQPTSEHAEVTQARTLSPKRSTPILAWVEGALFSVGAAFGLWCLVTIMEARYFNSLPVPSSVNSTARTLPGEGPDRNPRRPSTVTAGSWIARLDAPSVNLRATVLEGSDETTLNRAAGHIEDTPLPGQRGNVAIAAHRDTIFRPVRNLRVGDPLVLTTTDRVYHYRVARLRVVEPNDVAVLDPADHPTLTLVTCYPFTFIGHAPKRFIVSADLVGEESRVANGAAGKAREVGKAGLASR
jgi:LPXTG-site transpeptidase (sortase) family protein